MIGRDYFEPEPSDPIESARWRWVRCYEQSDDVVGTLLGALDGQSPSRRPSVSDVERLEAMLQDRAHVIAVLEREARVERMEHEETREALNDCREARADLAARLPETLREHLGAPSTPDAEWGWSKCLAAIREEAERPPFPGSPEGYPSAMAAERDLLTRGGQA